MSLGKGQGSWGGGGSGDALLGIIFLDEEPDWTDTQESFKATPFLTITVLRAG